MRDMDPMGHTDTAHVKLEESQYTAEIELADRYQSFTAELLRLALLGIAVFGFIFKEVFLNFEASQSSLVPIDTVKNIASFSIIFFGICVLFALLFRYFSTEATRIYLEALRFQASGQQEKANSRLQVRCKVVQVCIISKAGAAICLGLGATLVALVFIKLLA